MIWDHQTNSTHIFQYVNMIDLICQKCYKYSMAEALAEPFPPERHEQAVLMGLIDVLHEHKENALQLQRDQLEAHSRALQPIQTANYVVTFFKETPEIPAQHTRIVFGPQYNAPVYEGVERIIARFPLTREDVYPEHTEQSSDDPSRRVPSERPWNDIFIELVDSNGNRQNYLLNGKGMVPFEVTDDVVADLAYEETDDLFTVYKVAERPLVETDLFTMSYLLTYKPGNPDAYVYHQQTNEADPLRQQ